MTKSKKKKVRKVKAWVALWDSNVLGVFTKNPAGKDTDLLTKVIAQTQKVDYKIVPCEITYKI